MDPLAYEYLMPTASQKTEMEIVRCAAKVFGEILESMLPAGADKTFAIRNHRTTAMWANVAITRYTDGTPRA